MCDRPLPGLGRTRYGNLASPSSLLAGWCRQADFGHIYAVSMADFAPRSDGLSGSAHTFTPHGQLAGPLILTDAAPLFRIK